MQVAENSSSLHVTENRNSLDFRVPFRGKSVLVRVYREALEKHFGAMPGKDGLAEAYLSNQEVIDARALDFALPGGLYTDDHPLELKALDFES